MSRITLPLWFVVILSACSPAMFESEPVTVKTDKGSVVCQLYTREIVEWDRPITFSTSITPDEAYHICLREGIRELNSIDSEFDSK